MVPNLNPTTFLTLIAGVAIFIFIMLLPALVEIKKPKDAGPRIIIENLNIISQAGSETLPNMEENHKLDQKLINKVAEILSPLYNLES